MIIKIFLECSLVLFIAISYELPKFGDVNLYVVRIQDWWFAQNYKMFNYLNFK
jgi:hypothetical protein